MEGGLRQDALTICLQQPEQLLLRPAVERTAALAGTIPLLSAAHRVLSVELSKAICVALSVTQGHLCLWGGQLETFVCKIQSQINTRKIHAQSKGRQPHRNAGNATATWDQAMRHITYTKLQLHTSVLPHCHSAALPPAAAAAAAFAAAASALHAGLCVAQCACWQSRLQKCATRHPPHMQLCPDTSFASDCPRTVTHPGLLQKSGTGMLLAAAPNACSCCTSVFSEARTSPLPLVARACSACRRGTTTPAGVSCTTSCSIASRACTGCRV